MAGLDALDLDAEAEPPDGKLGEVEEAIGAGERDAVVGADGSWQAALAEQLLEGGYGRLLVPSMASHSSRKREAWSVTVRG